MARQLCDDGGMKCRSTSGGTSSPLAQSHLACAQWNECTRYRSVATHHPVIFCVVTPAVVVHDHVHHFTTHRYKVGLYSQGG